jgi:RND family efflux transporter, MFP subunit
MKEKILILTLLVASLYLWSCGEKKETENNGDRVIPVNVKPIQMSTTRQEVTVTGNIEGNKTVRLGFMVAGKINYIAAEEGRNIRAGQLLASLDPESYRIGKDMADANLAQAQDEYSRLNLMHDRKSISESDFSKISNTLKVAKAQQHLQNKNLSDTRLYSPINGILLKKGAEKGEIVSIGMPLFVVSDIRSVKVNASVPESDLHGLHIGNIANVYVASLDATFTGKITEIGSLAEASTRTFNVKVELKNPELRIRPGMTAEVRIQTDKTRQSIAIPAEAILHDVDNSSYVYVADNTKKRAFKRKIALGTIQGNDIEIMSGLDTGDLLVITGQQKLSNGSAITLK